jgi:hypothetical protein
MNGGNWELEENKCRRHDKILGVVPTAFCS